MITDVEVVDYQSLKKASIKLGRFTVITGPSNSGKSGLIRAIRLVVFNARGISYIRHGAKTAKAALGIEREDVVVGIERGGRGADKYRVARPADVPDDPVQVDTYTKLEGKVPAEVAAILQLGEVNFAGQHDLPYLLTESGGQVARVLGELTNVTLVFDAAREANRRKLETARQLKQAEAVLADLKQQALGFRGLKEQIAAAYDAREHLACIDQISDSLGRLRTLSDTYGQAHAAAQRAQDYLERLTPPSADIMTERQQRLARLREVESYWYGAAQMASTYQDEADSWQAAEEQLHAELHEMLVRAGTCPTCGQPVSGLCPTG